MSKRQQYLIVIAIVIIVYTFGFYIANNQEPLDIVYPNENTILSSDDFLVDFAEGQVNVGCTQWNDAMQVIPQGKTLGMSTIYKPEKFDVLLTFTEHENILCKLHITDTHVATNRNVKVNDSFSKVVEAYGENYAYVAKKGEKDNFDIAYGAEHTDCIFFQIRDNQVSKIILQKDPQLK